MYSAFLTELNEDSTLEGNHIFSVWSLGDDILTNSGIVYARPTALVPNSSCYKIYTKLTHMETKELTVRDQYRMVVYHTCL
uniref:Uncharacterized protein n=1 Tax=Panagrolaimus sp. JU765 TaxID=591449 RepID=A0AC34R1K7_9BILA